MLEFRKKLRVWLDRSLADARDRGIYDIDAVVDMFRTRFNKTLEAVRDKNPQNALRLSQAFEEEISDFRQDNAADSRSLPPEPTPDSRPLWHSGESASGADDARGTGVARRFSASAFLAGAVAGMLALALGYIARDAAGPRDNPAGAVIAAADVLKAEPVVVEAIALLKKIKAELDENLDAVPVKKPGRFERLATAMPDNYKTLSRAARSQVRLTFRKLDGGYKVLATSAICPLVVSAEPAMLDPRRETRYAMLCSHFGVWNDVGKDF